MLLGTRSDHTYDGDYQNDQYILRTAHIKTKGVVIKYAQNL